MWWDILKVNIDFTSKDDIDSPKGMGHYEASTLDPKRDRIKINQNNIYDYVRRILRREPTEQELEEYTKRVIMHEAGHAAHRSADDKFFERTPEQKEYLAYMLEFPENPYIALKEFLKHPDTMDRSTDHLMWLMGWGANKDYKEAPEKINQMMKFIDAWAKTNSQKLKLTKIELNLRQGKNKPYWGTENYPTNFKDLLRRYDSEHHKFLKTLEPPPMGTSFTSKPKKEKKRNPFGERRYR